MATMSFYPQDPRVQREAEALARRSVAVDIVCLRGHGQPAREQLGSVTAHRVLHIGEKSSVPKYIWLSILFFRAAAAALATLYRQQRFDLIQVHNLPDYLVYIARPFKKKGIPVLLDLHDLMPELFVSRWPSRLSRPFAALIEQAHRSSCSFADHLLTASEGFARQLQRRGVPPERVTLVLNSADHHIFNVDRPPRRQREGPPRLLYHGTMAPRFGIHHLIDGIDRLRSSLGEVTLQLHGNYDTAYRRQLERQVQTLGLAGCVRFGEYLSLEKIRTVIDWADIGVVPYASDPFMDLALSTKVFEYIAMGLPVVVSRLPSVTGLFAEDCLQYFQPGDPEDLARKISELWADPLRSDVLCANALAAYQPLAWPIMERRYLDVITRLTGVELAS